jgi:hypothetical protein
MDWLGGRTLFTSNLNFTCVPRLSPNSRPFGGNYRPADGINKTCSPFRVQTKVQTKSEPEKGVKQLFQNKTANSRPSVGLWFRLNLNFLIPDVVDFIWP